MEYISIVFGLIFANNFVLARFLGLCPFVGVSSRLKAAVGMGMAVTFVMTLASAVTFLVFRFLESAEFAHGWNLTFMRTIVFILVIASLVQFVEMAIQKLSPGLYRALGIYLPLITTNCAVLGVAILNVERFTSGAGADPAAVLFIKAVLQGFSAGLGFTLAMILMASLRERFEKTVLPESVRDIPITFISAGLMALAFMGFAGMV
jgi:electron transport complex protein RnfA